MALDLYLATEIGPSWRQDPRLLAGLRLVVVLLFAVAWRLRRGRVAWALAALWLVAEALWRVKSLAAAEEPEALLVALASAVLLPLHLAAAAVLREWWVASRGGLLRFLLLAAEAAILVFLASEAGTAARQGLAAGLGRLRLEAGERLPQLEAVGLLGPGAPMDAYALPLLRLAAFVAAGVVIGWALRHRRTPLEAGLLGALVAIFPATLRADLVLLSFGAAAVVLGVALLENAVRLAFDDGLTGLPARRALEESLAQLGGSYALAMVDIDHFKKLNDRHGHEVGDQVLRKVAARLARVKGGRAFRYGGEEFTLVFPGRAAAEVAAAVEAVRESVAGEPFRVRSPGRPATRKKGKRKRGEGGGEKSLKVTVSVGLAERGESSDTPEAVLKAADKALYRSKRSGRNRLTVAR